MLFLWDPTIVIDNNALKIMSLTAAYTSDEVSIGEIVLKKGGISIGVERGNPNDECMRLSKFSMYGGFELAGVELSFSAEYCFERDCWEGTAYP